VLDAIEIARISGRRLRIAAKEPFLERERQYYAEAFAPARGRAANADLDDEIPF